MSDETPDQASTPGSRAGDATQSSQVPRLSRDAGPKAATTDKGRPRAVAVEDKVEPEPTPKPAPTKTEPKKTAPAEKAENAATSTEAKNGSNGSARNGSSTRSRPLTAGDYLKTTGGSPESTSVIPAVKDVPPVPEPQVEPDSEAEPDGRRASLRLTYVDPWSVTKLAFAISVALMIVAVVATTIFWLVLDATGVWGQINGSVNSVLSDDDSAFNITDYLGFGRLVGLTLVLSAINVIVMTALATVAAHLYNLGSQLLGGVEVTFAERD